MSPQNLLSGMISASKSKFVNFCDYFIAIASGMYGLYHLFGFASDPSFYLGFGLLAFSAISFYLAVKKPGTAILHAIKGTKNKK